MLRVFEAFAGYGSQRMALRNLGIEHEVVAISEFDKYADASYQAIHGETWNMGDITKIDVDDVPDHDLFTYSFPCQDISIAGKGKGFSKDSGTRSGLLWESERIIKAKKPKYLLMENVKNLIGKKFIDGFIEWTVALEKLGYSNYYEVLNAKDFGIPQNRERVFMVSILGEHDPYVFPKPIKLEKRLKDVLEDEVDEKYYLDNERAQRLIATITDSNEIGYVPYKEGGKQHQSNTVYDKEKVAPTIEARDYKGAKQILEPERVLGIFDKENSTHQAGSVYNKEKIAPTLDTMQGGWRQPSIIEPNFVVGSTQKNASVTDGSYSPTLTSSMGTGGGHVPMIDEPKIAASRGRNPENSSDRTKGAPTEQRLEFNGEGTSNTLTTVQKDNYVVEPLGTLASGSSKQFGVGYMEGLSKTLKANKHDISVLEGIPIKNDVVPEVIGGIGEKNFGSQYRQGNRVYDVTKIATALTASPVGNAGGYSPLYSDPKGVVEQYRIRKLTPLECFRLMDVTDEDFYKAQAVNSNSQLYKQAGNSIVVSVLEAIFRNMFLEVPDEDLIGENIPLF